MATAPSNMSVGLFSIGLDTYWPQFDGLLDNLNGYHRKPAKGFMNAWSEGGPAHHCAVGIGHIAGKIEKLGALLGIEVSRIC